MRVGIVSFTKKGRNISSFLEEQFEKGGCDTNNYVFAHLVKHGIRANQQFIKQTKKLFLKEDYIIFIGIYTNDLKAMEACINNGSNPAIIVIDDEVKHVISVVDGTNHKASYLTRWLADYLLAQPIILEDNKSEGHSKSYITV